MTERSNTPAQRLSDESVRMLRDLFAKHAENGATIFHQAHAEELLALAEEVIAMRSETAARKPAFHERMRVLPPEGPSLAARINAALHACEGLATVDLQRNQSGWLHDLVMKAAPLENDAARYQSIREHGIPCSQGDNCGSCTGDELDAQVDDALAHPEKYDV